MKAKTEPTGKIARIGGGVFKRTINQKPAVVTTVKNIGGLTNRPEFQSKSLPQKKSSSKKIRNRHEENIPEDGARLVIRNLRRVVI
jgi:hypothetical protein